MTGWQKSRMTERQNYKKQKDKKRERQKDRMIEMLRSIYIIKFHTSWNIYDMSAIYWDFTKMQHWYWYWDKRWWIGLRRHPDDLKWPTKIEKGGLGRWERGGAVTSRFFDRLNSMIYDLKRSLHLRWLFDPVLHSSLDYLVFLSDPSPINWLPLSVAESYSLTPY